MYMPEGSPRVEAEPAFDEAHILATYGLTPEEALQTVEFGEQGSAPLWHVLGDDRCPVGSWVKTAYQEGGREAVETKLTLFNQIAPEFTVAFGDDAKKKF